MTAILAFAIGASVGFLGGLMWIVIQRDTRREP